VTDEGRADGGTVRGNQSGAATATTETVALAESSNLLRSFRLLPGRWDRWMYVVLPAAAFLQWILVVPLAINNDVLTAESSGFDPLREGLVSGVQPTGFFNDFFFIVWNLFPIVLWAAYMVADRFAIDWVRNLNAHVDTTEAADSIRRLERIRDHWLPTVLIFLFGIAGMAAQIPKQLGFFETGSQLYWWDWRVSPAIFTIRDLALFFNVMLVVLVFWGTLFGLLILIQAVRKGNVNPDFFHPDDAGGLLPLGNAVSVMILPWVAGSFLGVMGWFDHTTPSELLFRVGDVMLILVCTVVAVALFAAPLIYVQRDLAEDVEHIKENLYSLANRKQVAHDLLSEQADSLRQADPTAHELSTTASVILLNQRLDNINGWPIDNQRILQVALLVASPGITVLTNAINEFISTYWF